MNIENAAARARLAEDWKTLTFEAYASAPNFADLVCQMEDSNADINVYDVLIQIPTMRRFRDQVVAQKLAYVQIRLANDDWESTVEVKLSDIENNALGRYTNKFKALGQAAKLRADRSLGQILRESFTTNDYTGTPFFSANKPHIPGVVDAGTFTNLMTEKPSANSWDKAKKLLANIRDKNGDPINMGLSRVVVCSPTYESTFKRLLNAELVLQISGGVGAAVTNIYQGDAELVVLPWLAAAEHNWFVMDTSTPFRAVINQTATQPRFMAQDNPAIHSEAFKRHVALYQVSQRGDVGYGLPQLAVGSTGADAAL
jgi:phage major head subunit gpT-like protein